MILCYYKYNHISMIMNKTTSSRNKIENHIKFKRFFSRKKRIKNKKNFSKKINYVQLFQQ